MYSAKEEMWREPVNFLTAMSVIKEAAWMADGGVSAWAPSHLGCKLTASSSAVARGANLRTSALSAREAVFKVLLSPSWWRCEGEQSRDAGTDSTSPGMRSFPEMNNYFDA